MAKESKITIKIGGKVDPSLSAAATAAANLVKGIGSIGGKSVVVAASALKGMTLAAVAAGAASVKIGSDFEAAMSSVAATSGATAEEYAMLEAAAREMGRTTSKTATESANALEYMSLAGWTVQESIEGLPSILKLSEASGMDLATCSDLVTDSMSALGLEVQDLAGYLDVAAAANNRSNQTAQQLMEAYLGVGGTLTNLGVPIEESAAALGVLANRGIKGSEAGTALNAVLVNLTTGTGQAGAMMEKLGISAFDAEGNFIGLEATLQAVSDATAGMTDEERNAALAAIGGKTHIDALNDLLAGLNTTTADGVTEWESLQGALENCEGAMDAMRDVKLDNLQGDFSKFTSAVQDAGISIYKELQQPLRGVTQYATDMVNQLNSAVSSAGFSGAALSVGPMLAGISGDVSSAGSSMINAGFEIVNNLLTGIQQNAGAIAGAAADLVSTFLQGFAGYYSTFWTTGAELLSQFLQGIQSHIGDIVTAATTAVQNLVQGLIESGPQILSAGINIIAQLISGIGQAAPNLINSGIQLMAALFQALVQGIAQNLPQIITGGIQIVVSLVSGLIQAIPLLLSQIPVIFQAFVEGIMAVDWGEVGHQILEAIGSGLTNIGGLLERVVGSFGSSLTSGMTGAGTDGGTAAGVAAYNGMVSAQSNYMLAGKAAADSYSQGITTGGTTIMSSAEGAVSQATEGFSQISGKFMEEATNAMTQAADGITAGGEAMKSAAQGVGEETGAGISEGLTTSVDGLDLSFISDLVDDCMSQSNAFVSSGTDEMQSTVDATTAQVESVTSSSMSTIESTVQTSMSSLVSTVQSAMTAFVSAIQSGCSSAVSACQSAAAGISGAFSGINLYGIGVNIVSGLVSGMQSQLSRVQAIASQIASAASSAMASAAKVASPSRVTMEIGQYVGEGFALGIEAMSAEVEAAAEGLSNNVTAGFKAASAHVATVAWKDATEAYEVPDIAAGLDDLSNSGYTLPQMEAPGPIDWRDPFEGSGDAGPTYTITYSPVFNLSSGSTKDQVMEAARLSQAEFTRMMDRYLKTVGRTRF